MIDPEDQNEDKGLFTFYRQQAEREDQIKRQKRNRKKKKDNHILLEKNQSQKQIVVEKPVRVAKTIPHTKNFVLKEVSLKPKMTIPKQRLIESIVDMGKQMQNEQQVDECSNSLLRSKEPSFIVRNRKYQQKISELKANRGYQYNNILDEGNMLNEIHYVPLQRLNQSVEYMPEKNKLAIHSARDSVVQLPDIRKSDQIRVPYRPKKSIKSKMIQQAMHTRDRSKIKQIRQYLKFSSPRKLQNEEESCQQLQMDKANFQIFELRQQKLLGILKRFRKAH